LETGSKADDDSSGEFSLDLVSPQASAEVMGIFGVVPQLSFDEDIEALPDGDDLPKGQVSAILREFQNRFIKLKQKWSQSFADVEASHLLVVKDLQKLRGMARSIKATVGKPTQQGLTLWENLQDLSTSLSERLTVIHGDHNCVSQAVNRLQTVLDGVQQSLLEYNEEQELLHKTVDGRLQQAERCLQVFEQRFTKILPMLMSIRSGGKTSANNELEVIQNQVRELAQKVETMQELVWDKGVSAPPLNSDLHLSEVVRDLRSQVALLQQRVVGGGVQIGAIVFQSFEDVETWVKAELPNQRYGLFVDAVSLLDFFTCIGHVDAEKTFSSFHSQQKTGFSSMYGARVAALVQNLFPMVFGKSSSTGLDDSEFLPAIQDPDKWDNGVTGLKHQICRGMSDVEYQIESAIETVLSQHVEARQLAKECLYKAKRCVSELCNFISNDYQKWKHRGHGKRDAWRMTAVSARRVFEEIHSERVVARDIYDYKDNTFSTAKFLWATFKAHSVMDRYIKHQFYEHPAIAAVLARHLADNYVKPDDALVTKLNTLDKAHKALVVRVDSMASREKENIKAKNEKGRGQAAP
jgi:hypothetical protein